MSASRVIARVVIVVGLLFAGALIVWLGDVPWAAAGFVVGVLVLVVNVALDRLTRASK